MTNGELQDSIDKIGLLLPMVRCKDCSQARSVGSAHVDFRRYTYCKKLSEGAYDDWTVGISPTFFCADGEALSLAGLVCACRVATTRGGGQR